MLRHLGPVLACGAATVLVEVDIERGFRPSIATISLSFLVQDDSFLATEGLKLSCIAMYWRYKQYFGMYLPEGVHGVRRRSWDMTRACSGPAVGLTVCPGPGKLAPS